MYSYHCTVLLDMYSGGMHSTFRFVFVKIRASVRISVTITLMEVLQCKQNFFVTSLKLPKINHVEIANLCPTIFI